MPRSATIRSTPSRWLNPIVTSVVIGFAALITAPAAFAASVTAVEVTAPKEVEVGDSFTVTVTVAGAVDLFAYDAQVAYDESVVAFVPDSDEYPDGGFGTVSESMNTVAVAYTRLGTSPGLVGDLTIATLEFTAVSAGDAALSMPAVTLVGTDGTTSTFADVTVGSVTVSEPIVEPGPDPTPTTPPVADGDEEGGGSGSPTDETTDGLAATGGSLEAAGALIAAAIAAIAAGVVLIVRRVREGAVR